MLAKSLKGSIYESGDIETIEQAFEIIKNNVIFTPINMDKETGEQKKIEFALSNSFGFGGTNASLIVGKV